MRSRLNSSTFWVFEPVFRFLHKNKDFVQIYLNTGSKCGKVKPRSDTYSIMISGKISKVLGNITPS